MSMQRLVHALGLLATLALASSASAAPTRVGNGDDGTDLEGFKPIEDGPIMDARERAIDLVKRLNTAGISGLGALLPELRTSPIYITRRDVVSRQPEDKDHGDSDGQVFARTFAEPHAPTRFFPIAERLEPEQLVALHVHEALHRALPASVNEDETIVGRLTMAITSPDSTHDRVAQVAEVVFSHSSRSRSLPDESAVSVNSAVAPIPEHSRVHLPSTVSYTFYQYQRPKGPSLFPAERMHVFRSFLYPFGNDRTPVGIGIEGALVTLPKATHFGPLSISGRIRLWTLRGFDIAAFGSASLNTLSAEELKNSPMGRDVFTAGLSMTKDLKLLYFENSLAYSAEGRSTQKLGQIETTYSYGSVINASVRSGVRLGAFKVGGVGDIYLSDYYRVTSKAFDMDTGRYRIISAGPELSWGTRDFALGLNGRFIVDATSNADFDFLGQLLGPGVAQGNVGATASYFF